MYNSYVSSSVYSIQNKGSLFNSFNEYPIFLNERFIRTPLHVSSSPSSSSSCCCCCLCNPFPTHRVPRGPSVLYGTRQSILLQWSTSRRLVLGGRNRFRYRFPEYGCDRDCYEVSCYNKGGGVCHRCEGRRQRICCMVSESDCEFQKSNGFDEDEIAEAMVSLMGEEGFGSRDIVRSTKRAEVGKRGSFGGKERSLSSARRVELEKRGGRSVKENKLSSFEKITVDQKRYSDSRYCGGERKSSKLGSLKSEQNNKVGSITTGLRKDESRRNEGKLVHSRDDNQTLRKEGSSCSSYYSVSTSGDIENDAEVEDKNVQFVEESSSRYRYDSASDVGQRFDGQAKLEFKRQGDNDEGQEEDSMLGNAAVGTGADWRLRKNSEKKLSEVSSKEKSAIRETSERNSRLSRTRESDCETISSSKKFLDKEEKSKLAVTLNEQSKQYDVSGKQVDVVVINERKKLAEVSDISCSDAEAISCQKRLVSKNETLELDADLIQDASENNQEASSVLNEKSLRSSSFQQLLGVSDNKRIETKRASHQRRQSDAMINTGKSMDVVSTSTQEIKERRRQVGKHVIGEIDSRQNVLHLGVISVIKDGSTNTAVSSSETITKNEEQNAVLVNTSSPGARHLKSQKDHNASQNILSRKGSRDGTDISVVHGTDKLSATHSRKAFENRIVKEETNKSLVEKTVKETKRRHGQINDQVVKIESGKETETHVERIKLQGSFNLISQTSYQGIGVNMEENRSSEALLMPPPSQLVARDPLHVDSTSEMANQVVSSRTSGSSSSALHMQSGGSSALHRKSHRKSRSDESTGEITYLITPDDALGSADRLERSSTQFVGEFIQKSRNELLISESQKEEISEIDLVHDVEKHRQQSSSNHGSVDYQMKDHDSRLSSRSSGTKGPSDEMWHVTDSAIEQPPKAEDPEISAHSENAIVKRSGRSLWSILTDIVHLRWNSRAETSDSALRSGGRTSPNESVSNETWFSGREHEETDNTKMGRTATPSKSTSSDQLEQPDPSAQNQDLSGDSKSKNIYYEVDTASSPNIMQSESSGGNLLVSGQVDLKDGGKRIEVVSSGLIVEQSSLPLPPQGKRGSPIIEEISHDGKNDAFASSSTEQLERPDSEALPEISTTGTKDGELKQRKLQRNKQVLRDRFDEWEEAYIVETEQRKIDEMFMREALAEAKKAADTWEVPVGAVLVKHGKVIARGCNLVEELRDSTAHAEMICIREASKILKSWRLAETTLYVTLEPCPMCAGAILQARIGNLVWGAPNKLLGADGSWIRLFPDGGDGNVSEVSNKPAAPVHPFHPNMEIRRGVLAAECADVMQQFFQLRRRKKEKKENNPPLSIAHHPSKFLTKMHNIFHMLFCL